MAGPVCLPCGGGNATGIKQQVTGGAGGRLAMQRANAVQRTWIVTCPDGESTEVIGDTAAYQAAASCGGSYSIKSLNTYSH